MRREDISRVRIAVIGLGYVGLPLAAEFGKHFPTLGFDISQNRISSLKGGVDSTLEVSHEELSTAKKLSFSCLASDLQGYNVYIVTVPTPIDEAKRPDLNPLRSASELLSEFLLPNDVVIYESTVYPGATEEVCVPLLEAGSGLIFNKDFFVGYSPERINPGDKNHRLTDITKVTAGSTPETAEFVDQLYGSIINAGTHKVTSIRVAEAAKVIENTQRDVNIALINELVIIFHRLAIDTEEVLNAAGTKWNFLSFRPGLVGGHCIGVDPYYLTHKAQEVGYHPKLILAGREINDQMGEYVASRVVKAMLQKELPLRGGKVLLLGLTFKENCPDVRNTRVIDVYNELKSYGLEVDVHDPWVDQTIADAEFGIKLLSEPEVGAYDAVVIAVAHQQFKAMGYSRIEQLCKPKSLIFDVKYVLPVDTSDERL